VRATLAEEADCFQVLLASAAARECLAAFLDKRAPRLE